MYTTNGYPIDYELRRIYLAQRGPHCFATIRALLARFRHVMAGRRARSG
jgi:hypothetical protein